MKLNELHDNPGAVKKSRRVGRGLGSGKGKTCGSGQKGQKARTGVSINGFEGGQNPLYRRLPKRGFTNIFAVPRSEVNIGHIQKFVEAGKIDSSKAITKEILLQVGLVRAQGQVVKLLGKGQLKSALTIEVDQASKGAIALVEKAKGKVILKASAA